ncbi:MAG: hypothetical protein MI745_15560 [Pseudomonadales bacterium]|nr:hypothetical protein [Pseudomonadales bacterium]
MLAAVLLFPQSSRAHGILPDEIPMAAGTALRNPGNLPVVTVNFYNSWAPATLSPAPGEALSLRIQNHSDDWHLFALGDEQALRDQDLIHRLMPDLRKDYPNTRLSEPDTTVTLPWRFDRAGTFELRCVRAAHQGSKETLVIKVVP